MKILTALAVFLFAMSSNAISENLPPEVTVRLLGPEDRPGPSVTIPSVKKTDAEWLAQLGEARFRILRQSGTERAFCGTLLDNKKDGVYLCAACSLPLFSSSSKFKSGTGWPSFFQPFASENVAEIKDASHGMTRVEVVCTRCGGHLGHVFPDGPEPTGMRYCLNSEALTFLQNGTKPPAAAAE